MQKMAEREIFALVGCLVRTTGSALTPSSTPVTVRPQICVPVCTVSGNVRLLVTLAFEPREKQIERAREKERKRQGER